jgi:hypothetical protein
MDRKSVAAAAVALLVPVAALTWVATSPTLGTDDQADQLVEEETAEMHCSATGAPRAELAAHNAHVDALADYLHAHGIEHQTWIDNGRHYVDWDRQDPSAQAAVDAFEAAAGDEAGALPIDVGSPAEDSGC